MIRFSNLCTHADWHLCVQNRLLDHLESYGLSRRDLHSNTWNALLGALLFAVLVSPCVCTYACPALSVCHCGAGHNSQHAAFVTASQMAVLNNALSMRMHCFLSTGQSIWSIVASARLSV